MKKTVLLTAIGLLAASPVWAQANLRPDHLARVPPQPGQSLPVEDIQFLKGADALSRLETELGRLATQKAATPALKDLGGQITEQHEKLGQEIARKAQDRSIDLAKVELAIPDQGGVGGAASAVTNPEHVPLIPEGVVAELRTLNGEAFDQRYVQAQLDLHERLADLYQTQSSHTTDQDLASFAITHLTTIQHHRDQLRGVASDLGMATDWEGQAPQYATTPQRDQAAED